MGVTQEFTSLADVEYSLRALTEFFDQQPDINIDKLMSDFEQETTSFFDFYDRRREDPLLFAIRQARITKESLKSLHDPNSDTEVRINKDAIDGMQIGKSISKLKDKPIISPSGDDKDVSLSDVYASRLLNSDYYRDAVFELNVAAGYANTTGCSVKIVDEGEQSGPDLYLSFDELDVWLECKRKRYYTPQEEIWRNLERDIDRRLESQSEISDKSFAVRVLADVELKPEYVKPIVRVITDQIQDNVKKLDVKIDEESFRFKLEDVASPSQEMSMECGMPINADLDYVPELEDPNPFYVLNLSPTGYQHEDLLNGGYCMMDAVEDDDSLLYTNRIVDLEMEWDLNYAKWIENTIQSGRSNLSGFAPSILMISVPSRVVRKAQQTYCINHEGKQVKQQKRIRQICRKELNDSDSLNVIEFNTRIWNPSLESVFQEGHPIVERSHVFREKNIDAKIELPEDWERRLFYAPM